MANKTLADLAERTSTSDTDIIHINVNGTDYKQQKSNFLGSLLTNSFLVANDAATSISDANDVSLHGVYWVHGNNCSHLPSSAASFYAYILCFGRFQMCCQHSADARLVRVYVRNYTNSTWYPWREMPAFLTAIETPTLTASSGVSFARNQVRVAGNICWLSGVFSAASDLSAGSTIATLSFSNPSITDVVLSNGGDATMQAGEFKAASTLTANTYYRYNFAIAI